MESRIGNYQVIEKLGEGGMGEVYRGLDIMLEREVAIKLLRPELSRREDLVERFRTEAVALARLNHPNIATLYSFSRHEDQYYMVMEFVRGEPLDTVIATRGALPWREAVRGIVLALEGLEHAHRLGIVHRDVKPANMMLTYSGGLKLMDFGIARILQKARLTRGGHLIGTLEYMSPEQIQGQETDARSDIYSVGAVLYEMLTGHLPFEKGTDYDLIKSQIEEPPPPLRTLRPEVPPRLEEAVLRALAKAPEDRFPSAQAFIDALEELDALEPSDPSSSARKRGAPETRLVDLRPTGGEAMLRPQSAPIETAAHGEAARSAFWRNYFGVAILGAIILIGLLTLGMNTLLSESEVEPVQQAQTLTPATDQAETRPVSDRPETMAMPAASLPRAAEPAPPPGMPMEARPDSPPMAATRPTENPFRPGPAIIGEPIKPGLLEGAPSEAEKSAEEMPVRPAARKPARIARESRGTKVPEKSSSRPSRSSETAQEQRRKEYWDKLDW